MFLSRCSTFARSFKGRGQLLLSARMMCSPATYSFETLNVTRPHDYVVHVEMNRPQKRNALTMQSYSEIRELFEKLSEDPDCRAIVLSGAGKIFCAGIDIMALSGSLMEDIEPGRKAFHIRKLVQGLQESMNVIEKCPKPVIAAVHNACVGGGVDMISACDIRYCTEDAWFQIKEIDIGIVADLGTLQRFPKAIGNESLARELAYTARKLPAAEAKNAGLVSGVFSDRDSLIAGAMTVAQEIAARSPVAVQGTKVNMVYSRDHSVQEGLDFVMATNQSFLQSEDVVKAAMGSLQKETPTFSKL